MRFVCTSCPYVGLVLLSLIFPRWPNERPKAKSGELVRALVLHSTMVGRFPYDTIRFYTYVSVDCTSSFVLQQLLPRIAATHHNSVSLAP